MKGFYYHYEDEKIKEYMKLDAKQKLIWLEELVKFSLEAMDEKVKRIIKKIKGY